MTFHPSLFAHQLEVNSTSQTLRLAPKTFLYQLTAPPSSLTTCTCTYTNFSPIPAPPHTLHIHHLRSTTRAIDLPHTLPSPRCMLHD
jgi:hypothetical protein